MNILLIHPPEMGKIVQFKTYKFNFPIGLMYIQSYLKREGFPHVDIKMYDSVNREEIIRDIDALCPDVVGLHCTTTNRNNTYALAQMIKAHRPSTIIVLGGIHATIMANQILNNFSSVDYVVLGEGEYVFKKLLTALRDNANIDQVRGIAYRSPGSDIIKTQKPERISQLDDLPFPCYDSLDAQKLAQTKHFCIVASRGCQFQCTYCCPSHFLSHLWLHRSEANIIEELIFLKRKYNPEIVTFNEACMTTDVNYAKKLFTSITKEDLGMTYHLQTRTEFVDEELLSIMKKAGVKHIGFGIESGSLRIRKYAGRPYSSQHLRNEKTVIQLTKKYDIKACVNFIVGWPNETWDDIKANVRLISEMKPRAVSINPLRLFPGNALYQEQVRNNVISDEYWLRSKLPAKYLVLKKGLIGRCQGLWHELILFITYLLNSSSLKGIYWTIRTKFTFMQINSHRPLDNNRKDPSNVR